MNGLYKALQDLRKDWPYFLTIVGGFTIELFALGVATGYIIRSAYMRNLEQQRAAHKIEVGEIKGEYEKKLLQIEGSLISCQNQQLNCQQQQEEAKNGESGLEEKVGFTHSKIKNTHGFINNTLKQLGSDDKTDSDEDGIPDIKDNCKWFYNPQQEEIPDRKVCDTSPYTDKYGANMDEEDETAE